MIQKKIEYPSLFETLVQMRSVPLIERTVSERLEDVAAILYNNPAALNQDSNTHHLLERLADYILNADKESRTLTAAQIKQHNRKEQQYRYENDYAVTGMQDNKKNCRQKILPQDLQDTQLELVRLYHTYQRTVLQSQKQVEKMLYLRDIHMGLPPKTDYKTAAQSWIRQTVKECAYEKLYWKDMLKGTIYFQHLMPNCAHWDFQMFDPKNIRHMRAAILCPIRPISENDPLSYLLYAVHACLCRLKLSAKEKDVLDKLRTGMEQKAVAMQYGVSQSSISQVITGIARKAVREWK